MKGLSMNSEPQQGRELFERFLLEPDPFAASLLIAVNPNSVQLGWFISQTQGNIRWLYVEYEPCVCDFTATPGSPWLCQVRHGCLYIVGHSQVAVPLRVDSNAGFSLITPSASCTTYSHSHELGIASNATRFLWDVF